MNWHSPAEFFAMGGYALYVWGSFGVVRAGAGARAVAGEQAPAGDRCAACAVRRRPNSMDKEGHA